MNHITWYAHAKYISPDKSRDMSHVLNQEKVGLLPDYDPNSDSLETDVNYLMSVALGAFSKW